MIMGSLQVECTALNPTSRIIPDSYTFARVNILHLSDLHFGVDQADKSKFEWRPNSVEFHDMLDMLIKTLQNRELVPEEWVPDIIVISGDIAWTGQAAQYEQFNSFLEQLITALHITETQKVLLCPGNHDILRSRVDNKYLGATGRPEKGKPVQCPEITYESIIEERWKHFEFFVQYCCDNNPNNLCRSITFPDWPWLHFLVLNSAWDCRSEPDEGTLRVGIKTARKLYADLNIPNTTDTVVAIFHHPGEEVPQYDPNLHIERPHQWLHDSERTAPHAGEESFIDFLGRRVDIICNGHIHRKIDPIRRKGRPYHFINGTVYSNDSFRGHCRIIQLSKAYPPKYIDLSRECSDMGMEWIVTRPIDPTKRDKNAWDAIFEELVNKASVSVKEQHKDMLPKLVDILSSVAIAEYLYIILNRNTNITISQIEEELVRLRRRDER